MTTHASNMSSNYVNTPPVMGQAAVMAGERPRRSVYVISERNVGDGTRSFWTKVGVAFENRDGSVTIKLEALPVSGTLQIRDDDKDRERRERASHAPF
ncbi:MAG: hypothetical protein AB2A00_33605 [Myxococcota bacterium]